MEVALANYDAWATGVRRDESATRATTPVVQYNARRGKVKVNPIARWSHDELDAYIADNHILVSPLIDDGFLSIGCWPCTKRGRSRRRSALGPLGRPGENRMRHQRMTAIDDNSLSTDADGLATSPADRRPGCTVWLTGLPSAGKSTIARALGAAVDAPTVIASRCSTAMCCGEHLPATSASAEQIATPT